jgi:RNA polymerase sigma factor (sigma-70 family)
MPEVEADSFLETRRSLITRLKNWDDQESWREFFQTYWKLIYSVALKSGLTDFEAEDVVQETVLSIAKTMPIYRYDREKCRFKTWLMRMTRMRVIDQFRKRGPAFPGAPLSAESSIRTAAIDRVPDPAAPFLDKVWDEEWQKNLMDAAMERVKRKVKPQHYQIFYLAAVKEIKPAQVARTLGVNIAQVYLVKHRVAGLIRNEIGELERKPEKENAESTKDGGA